MQEKCQKGRVICIFCREEVVDGVCDCFMRQLVNTTNNIQFNYIPIPIDFDGYYGYEDYVDDDDDEPRPF